MSAGTRGHGAGPVGHPDQVQVDAAELREVDLTPVDLEPASVASGDHRQWLDAAAGVLRAMKKLPAATTDLDVAELEPLVLEALTRRSGDGVPVPPLGRVGATPADLPAGRRSPRTGAWVVRSVVDAADPASAAQLALAELEGGASSLLVRIGRGSDSDGSGGSAGGGVAPDGLDTALAPVLLDIAGVVLDAAAGAEAAAVQAFSAVLRERGSTPAAGTSFGVDPLGRTLEGHPDAGFLPDVLTAAQELGIGAVTIDGRRVHELGGGEVTEIGWSIAAGIATLRLCEQHGIPPQRAADLVSFRYAVTDDQFVSIAKLRAARSLWAAVLQRCGVDARRFPQYQHAMTSRPMTSRYDPWVNLLRGTIATFAAGVGGAQAVTTLPFDSALGEPDAFGRRIARNVSHLLIGESRVAEVADPAGGAAAVEQLTAELTAAAWDLVQQLERAGGAAAAVELVRDRAAQDRARRDRLIATRRFPLTGVSEFPHLAETLPTRPRGAAYDGCSWSEPFETLRDSPCATPVFLATLGPVAAHATRAGFVTGALAATGVAVVSATDAKRAGATAGFADARTPVAIVVGTDDAYAEQAAETIAELRAAGATTVLLAGRPSAVLADLVDGSVALGDDVLALGRSIRAALEGRTVDGEAS